jgi:Pet100
MRLGVGAEMAKFFIYCFFPVGIIYLFNRPDLQQHYILGGPLISQPADSKDLLYVCYTFLY